MPKKSFPFEQGGMERVTISWKTFWKNFTIEFDGNIVGTIPNQKELQKGRTIELPVDFLLAIGMGEYSIIIVGGIYLLLAFFVQRRSKTALAIALVVYGLETILSLMDGVTSGVIIRIFFFVFMWQGFGAIKELHAASENVIEYVE
jgi:hypothetical protein